MPPEKNLALLIKSMRPSLHPGEYVFCTVADPGPSLLAEAIMIFRETEGPTVVLERGTADRQGLAYTYVAAWITLTVHSSLEAVGLTAAFSTALAAENISCNVVAGYYHDHLFVHTDDAEMALAVLNRLSQEQ